jgi:hypothetical protein
VHLLFRLRGLRLGVAAEGRRLLRLLFLRIGSLSTGPNGAILLQLGTVSLTTAGKHVLAASNDPTTAKTLDGCVKPVRDDWAQGRTLLLIWGLPGALLPFSTLLGGSYRLFLWPTLLAWMAGACLINARRCRRLHCYLTAPYFLLLAIVSLLHGTGVLALGAQGWRMLSIALFVGGPFLIYVPERVFGRYRIPNESR